jgi:SOS-response transcriptional repressor LexA
MIIEFLEGADRATATPLQLETYDLLKDKLSDSRDVPIAELLAALNLTDPRPLVSRIEHLAEKGFLRLKREPDTESVVG